MFKRLGLFLFGPLLVIFIAYAALSIFGVRQADNLGRGTILVERPSYALNTRAIINDAIIDDIIPVEIETAEIMPEPEPEEEPKAEDELTSFIMPEATPIELEEPLTEYIEELEVSLSPPEIEPEIEPIIENIEPELEEIIEITEYTPTPPSRPMGYNGFISDEEIPSSERPEAVPSGEVTEIAMAETEPELEPEPTSEPEIADESELSLTPPPSELALLSPAPTNIEPAFMIRQRYEITCDFQEGNSTIWQVCGNGGNVVTARLSDPSDIVVINAERGIDGETIVVDSSYICAGAEKGNACAENENCMSNPIYEWGVESCKTQNPDAAPHFLAIPVSQCTTRKVGEC